MANSAWCLSVFGHGGCISPCSGAAWRQVPSVLSPPPGMYLMKATGELVKNCPLGAKYQREQVRERHRAGGDARRAGGLWCEGHVYVSPDRRPTVPCQHAEELRGGRDVLEMRGCPQRFLTSLDPLFAGAGDHELLLKWVEEGHR